MTTLERIADVACVGVDEITPATSLESLGIDSMDCLTLAAGSDLPKWWWRDCVTVGDVIAKLETQR